MAEERVEGRLTAIPAVDMANRLLLLGEALVSLTASCTVLLELRPSWRRARVIETVEEELSWHGR